MEERSRDIEIKAGKKVRGKKQQEIKKQISGSIFLSLEGTDP